jgi:hypothetical protein
LIRINIFGICGSFLIHGVPEFRRLTAIFLLDDYLVAAWDTASKKTYPIVFFKGINSLQNPGDAIQIPTHLCNDEVDYECERHDLRRSDAD